MCVRVGAKLQSQPNGSKLNPYQFGENFEWTQSTNGSNPGALMSVRTTRQSYVYFPDGLTVDPSSGRIDRYPRAHTMALAVPQAYPPRFPATLRRRRSQT